MVPPYIQTTVWLLCWTFITIGSTPANILTLQTLVFSVSLSLGVVLGLLAIIVLAAKIFLLITMPELDLILQNFLEEVTRNRNYGHTRTFIGIRL